MKTKQNILVIFIIAVMMQPFISKAQNLGTPWSAAAKKHNEKKVGWQPVKLDDKGSNVKSGVEFYSQDNIDCINNKIILVKLVNTNNYAVRISTQLSADSPAINVMVGASATIEGVCGATDGNLAKLVITPPVAKTNEEKQKNNEFMRSHIVVSQIQ